VPKRLRSISATGNSETRAVPSGNGSTTRLAGNAMATTADLRTFFCGSNTQEFAPSSDSRRYSRCIAYHDPRS